MSDRDPDAVRRLLYAYGDAVLARDASAWGALWTDDAVWELGPDRRVVGRGAIVELWRSAMADYRHVVQLYTSSTATIDGDDAVGRAYLVELNVPVVGDRRTFVGWYDDAYRRTAEGWRFSRRALHKLYAGAPDLSGQFFGVELD